MKLDDSNEDSENFLKRSKSLISHYIIESNEEYLYSKSQSKNEEIYYQNKDIPKGINLKKQVF